MELSLKLTDRQSAAYNALNKDEYDVVDVLYGGAKGGGKSWLLCNWVYLWSLAIIKDFKLKPTKNPKHIGWIGRKIGTDFTATTLQTWQEVIPEQDYEIKGATEKHPKHILIKGTVAVDYGGLDRREDISKFNSAEYVFIAVDQAEETTENDIATLRATRRMQIGGKPLKYKGLFTANPRNCWLKDEFITNPAKNRQFVQALPSDNPYLPDSYVETLKEAFSYRPELLSAYLHGSWSVLEGEAQVIKSSWVEIARQRPRLNKETAHKVISCDPARFGDDETVIYYFEDGIIVDELIYGHKDTTFTTAQLILMMDEKGCHTIVIDDIGVGGGVVDQINDVCKDKNKHWNIIPINGAEKSLKDKYYNKRAEIWDTVARQFSEGKVILRSDNKSDYVLENQLCVPTYEFRNGKLLIENKEEIKKRLGNSPDRADAYVMGLWVSITHSLPEQVAIGALVSDDKTAWDYDPLYRKRRAG